MDSSAARNEIVLRAEGLGALLSLVWAFLPKPLAVETGSVAPRQLQVTVDEDGRTRVKDRFVVSSPLMANAARSELSPGDEVTPQTVIARLLPNAPALLDTRSRAEAAARVEATSVAERQSHATIERVRASLEFAEHEVTRVTELHARGAVPDRALDQARLEVTTLQQELASAEFAGKVADHELVLYRAALGLFGRGGSTPAQPLEVRSPVRGRVLRILQQSEGVVLPGTALVELGDPAALEIVVDVLTSDAVHVQPGTKALITQWGGEPTLHAHVRLVEPSAVTKISALGVEEQRVNVVLDLDSPRSQWLSLGDGYRVEAQLVVWDGGSRLCAPASAVFRRGDGFALFRVEGDKARLTSVKVGRRNDEWVELLSPIATGSTVVVHPSDTLQDGMQVSTR